MRPIVAKETSMKRIVAMEVGIKSKGMYGE